MLRRFSDTPSCVQYSTQSVCGRMQLSITGFIFRRTSPKQKTKLHTSVEYASCTGCAKMERAGDQTPFREGTLNCSAKQTQLPGGRPDISTTLCASKSAVELLDPDPTCREKRERAPSINIQPASPGVYREAKAKQPHIPPLAKRKQPPFARNGTAFIVCFRALLLFSLSPRPRHLHHQAKPRLATPPRHGGLASPPARVPLPLHPGRPAGPGRRVRRHPRPRLVRLGVSRYLLRLRRRRQGLCRAYLRPFLHRPLRRRPIPPRNRQIPVSTPPVHRPVLLRRLRWSPLAPRYRAHEGRFPVFWHCRSTECWL